MHFKQIVSTDLVLHSSQELYLCRKAEKPLNKCVFEKMVRPCCLHMKLHIIANCTVDILQGLKKEIPGTPEGKAPIHEKKVREYTESH